MWSFGVVDGCDGGRHGVLRPILIYENPLWDLRTQNLDRLHHNPLPGNLREFAIRYAVI